LINYFKFLIQQLASSVLTDSDTKMHLELLSYLWISSNCPF